MKLIDITDKNGVKTQVVNEVYYQICNQVYYQLYIQVRNLEVFYQVHNQVVNQIENKCGTQIKSYIYELSQDHNK
jgi:hypothetical protein